jgi:oxaloacetate decarboxylase alpha subunit
MASIEYIDQTARDGQQSLWGMQMRAGHLLPVAPMIDDAGYRIVDMTGSGMMEVLTRFHRENYFRGLDAIRAAMPNATLRSGKRSNGLVGMGVMNNAILNLWMKTLSRHGVKSMWIFDCLHDVDQMRTAARMAMDNGITPTMQLNFSDSPVHTDDYYASVLTQLLEEPSLESIILGDEAGSLGVERARTWIPRMVELVNARGLPVELHFHDNTGQATLNHITGVEAGATILHTAVDSMANGPSMPSTQMSVDNMRRLGHEVTIDDTDLDAVSDHFAGIAAMEGYATGVPVEFSLGIVQSQVPGGMMGTLREQLKRENMLDRLPELLEESIQVRADMGYPVMATPHSQLVGIQALMNVVTGERFKIVPDENLMYLAGWYGKPPGPINEELLDRAWSTDRGRAIRDSAPPQPTIEEIRAEYGAGLSDEELLLRYLIKPEYVDAMFAADLPIKPIYPNGGLGWVTQMLRHGTARSVTAELAGVHLSLKR